MVRELDTDAGLPGDGEDLLHRIGQGRTFVAQMDRENGVMPPDGLRQRKKLFPRRRRARRIDQPQREAEHALGELLIQQGAFRRRFRRIRPPVAAA